MCKKMLKHCNERYFIKRTTSHHPGVETSKKPSWGFMETSANAQNILKTPQSKF